MGGKSEAPPPLLPAGTQGPVPPVSYLALGRWAVVVVAAKQTEWAGFAGGNQRGMWLKGEGCGRKARGPTVPGNCSGSPFAGGAADWGFTSGQSQRKEKLVYER